MKYGYFNDSTREYVITNPKTPVKWINYIGSIEFGGFVDHTGGALICKGDPALNRIIKYIPQLPASDFKGETLYVRLKEKNGYTIFSPYFVPTLDQYDLYECHVGLGYTRIISEFYDIRIEVTIFVPIDSMREIRDIKVTNMRNNSVEVDVIPVVEYTHFDALKQFTNADWVPQTMQSRAKDIEGYTLLTQYAFMNKENRINYFTSNLKASSFETERKKLLGDNEYGTWESPLGLAGNELNNSEANRGDNIAALMHHMGKLVPGETKRIITQLGQCENIENEKSEIKKYRSCSNVDMSFENLKNHWEEYLSKLQAETPDKAFNTMVNIHNPRQCNITKNWSRYLSLYQLGFGARGIGFRDTSQDLLGVMGFMPEEAKKMIEILLMMQKTDGSAMHQFNPLTFVGNEGDSREKEDRPHYYGDDHLWIVLTVCAYLKETGNVEFLNKEIPYYEKDKMDNPIERGSVLDHIERAIEFTYKNTGKHGLPLLGFADWNDTVNLPSGAESVFIAELFGYALKETIELLEYLNNAEAVQKYREYYDNMKGIVNEHAWDGSWFIRYFDYDGTPVGSSINNQGKIYINAQTWAVISGYAAHEKGVAALNSVKDILNTENGIKLSWPSYIRYESEKGGVTTYPPGAKENGGIFLHCNPWAIISETILKNGDQAYEYYNTINPVLKNDIIDRYECEPYVYAQNILGNEHPEFGAARNSWLSGTASWVYQAATKHILGIRPCYRGLEVNPCIPKKWEKFKVSRQFRGTEYEIEVKNPEGVCSGVKEMYVDGKKLEGNVIPIFKDKGTHKIVVNMGKK